eukprot:m.176076 g.176076  ORF g.176076 m.176076 type:complete len:1963 (+) comp18363_c0_seq13:138-6026(+)
MGNAIQLSTAAKDGDIATLHRMLSQWDGTNADLVRELNTWDDNGYGPLHYACRYGQLAATNLLINLGAHPDLPDKFGDSPLCTAASHGFYSICKALTNSNADISGRSDFDGALPLHRAAKAGHVHTVQVLLHADATLDMCDSSGRTALWVAAAADRPEVVRELMDAGASPWIRDSKGVTAAAVVAKRAAAPNVSPATVQVYELLGERARNLRVGTTLQQMRDNRTTSTVVDLSHSAVQSDEHRALVAVALMSNTTVTTLRLNGNPRFGDAGAVQLAMGLARNTTLRTLHLEDTGLTADGVAALAATLSRNSALHTLTADAPGAQRLVQLVRLNTKVQELLSPVAPVEDGQQPTSDNRTFFQVLCHCAQFGKFSAVVDLARLPQAAPALRWGAAREQEQLSRAEVEDDDTDTALDTTPVVIMPLARLLHHATPDAAAVGAVLAAHCFFDRVSAHVLLHAPSALDVLEAVVVDLAHSAIPAQTHPSPPVDAHGPVSGEAPRYTVLHAIVTARARLALTSAQAVRLVQRLIADAAQVLPVVDPGSGKDAVTMATSLPHCHEIAQVLCEHGAAQFFSRYVFDDIRARPWRQRVDVIEAEGRDTVGGGAVVLRMYARRQAWETEVSARELVPAAVLSDAVWSVLACAVVDTRGAHTTTSAGPVALQSADVYPAAQTSKDLRVAFASAIASAKSLVTLKTVGSLINAAVEDGRLLDADVHDLRCTYRQRAVAVHASTADGPRSSTASSAPVSVVSDNALQKPSDTQSEQVSAGQTHDRISADSSASTEISVSSSATKHHPSSHVRDATTSQPLSDDNLGVFLTEAMSVLSFEGIRSSVNSLRRKDGQGNAHIVATFVDAIAAADSLTALKFTGKQLKATATLLSEAELELLRRKYRERAEQVHSDGTASVSAKTPADVNGSSETPTSHGLDAEDNAMTSSDLWHCPSLGLNAAKMFVADADAGAFLVVGQGEHAVLVVNDNYQVQCHRIAYGPDRVSCVVRGETFPSVGAFVDHARQSATGVAGVNLTHAALSPLLQPDVCPHSITTSVDALLALVSVPGAPSFRPLVLRPPYPSSIASALTTHPCATLSPRPQRLLEDVVQHEVCPTSRRHFARAVVHDVARGLHALHSSMLLFGGVSTRNVLRGVKRGRNVYRLDDLQRATDLTRSTVSVCFSSGDLDLQRYSGTIQGSCSTASTHVLGGPIPPEVYLWFLNTSSVRHGRDQDGTEVPRSIGGRRQTPNGLVSVPLTGDGAVGLSTPFQLDLWGVGTLAYSLCTGEHVLLEQVTNIAEDGTHQSTIAWHGLSSTQRHRVLQAGSYEMLDLLDWLLDADAAARPEGVAEVVAHAFLAAKNGATRRAQYIDIIQATFAEHTPDGATRSSSSESHPCVTIKCSRADDAVALPIALQLSAHVSSLVLDTTLLCGTAPSTTGNNDSNAVVVVLVSAGYLDMLSADTASTALKTMLSNAASTARVVLVNLDIPAHLWPPPVLGALHARPNVSTVAVDNLLAFVIAPDAAADAALACLPYETTEYEKLWLRRTHSLEARVATLTADLEAMSLEAKDLENVKMKVQEEEKALQATLASAQAQQRADVEEVVATLSDERQQWAEERETLLRKLSQTGDALKALRQNMDAFRESVQQKEAERTEAVLRERSDRVDALELELQRIKAQSIQQSANLASNDDIVESRHNTSAESVPEPHRASLEGECGHDAQKADDQTFAEPAAASPEDVAGSSMNGHATSQDTGAPDDAALHRIQTLEAALAEQKEAHTKQTQQVKRLQAHSKKLKKQLRELQTDSTEQHEVGGGQHESTTPLRSPTPETLSQRESQATEIASLRQELANAQTQHKKSTKTMSAQHRQQIARLEREADSSQSQAAEWKAKYAAQEEKLLHLARSHSAMRAQLDSANGGRRSSSGGYGSDVSDNATDAQVRRSSSGRRREGGSRTGGGGFFTSTAKGLYEDFVVTPFK